ncbi:MAG: hypothetical protein WDM90_20615 [Ferruginibacter sp.]
MIKYISNKKSIIFVIGFLFFVPYCKAQQPANASYFFEQKQWANAKESIDSFVLGNTSNAEGWLLKAKIYNEISKHPEVADLVVDAKSDAFKALQKALQLNKAYVEQQLKPGGYNLPFDLYNGYTEEGLTYFNAGVEQNNKASFADALVRFKKAGAAGKLINENGWGLTAIDTNNLYYSAKAGINADKEDDAFLYSKKIADAAITKSTLVKDMNDVYQWLAFYFKQRKDEGQLLKYAALEMKYFPISGYGNMLLIDWWREKKAYTNLFAAYEQFLQRHISSKYQWAYLNDLFNYLYSNTNKVTDAASYKTKLNNSLTNFIKNNPANVQARLLMGKFYINQANDVAKESALRSTTNAKVLNGYTTAQRNLLLKSVGYLKEIADKFSTIDAVVYKEALKLLVMEYRQLGMAKDMKKYAALLAVVAFLLFILFNIILIIGFFHFFVIFIIDFSYENIGLFSCDKNAPVLNIKLFKIS